MLKESWDQNVRELLSRILLLFMYLRWWFLPPKFHFRRHWACLCLILGKTKIILWIKYYFCKHTFVYCSFYLFKKHLLSLCYVCSRCAAWLCEGSKGQSPCPRGDLWSSLQKGHKVDLKIIQDQCKTRWKFRINVKPDKLLFIFTWTTN